MHLSHSISYREDVWFSITSFGHNMLGKVVSNPMKVGFDGCYTNHSLCVSLASFFDVEVDEQLIMHVIEWLVEPVLTVDIDKYNDSSITTTLPSQNMCKQCRCIFQNYVFKICNVVVFILLHRYSFNSCLE